MAEAALGPIGIFDSGIGGLTVLARIAAHMPQESVVYLGDTARVPYGTKSAETVVRYARACAGVLLARGVKVLVVACNTASAFALDALRSELAIPVIGVVEPGARAAVRVSTRQRIGVIGTAGTVASGAYARAIAAIAPRAEVFCQPCPLFVPLAEEGWTDGPVPRTIAASYLEGLRAREIDTLVLGCTHYPLLAAAIQEVMGGDTVLVDSAEETALALRALLATDGLINPNAGMGEYHYLWSDNPASAQQVGERFLGRPLSHIEWVDF